MPADDVGKGITPEPIPDKEWSEYERLIACQKVIYLLPMDDTKALEQD